MNVVHVGDGHGRSDWIEIVRRHPDANSVAVVGGDAAGGVPSHGTLGEAIAAGQVEVAILTGAAACDETEIAEAIEGGVAVILDRPHIADLDALTRLAGLAGSKGRPLVIAGDDPGTPRLKAHVGKVGTVSHVSVVDRRPPAAEAAGANAAAVDPRHSQLVSAALDHFESVRRLLDLEPVRIMARCATPSWGGQGATTEAFLELENGLHLQYYGSTISGRTENVVWVEGRDGSLRQEGRGIWWRKRGWPRFAPWRWQLFGGTDPRLRRTAGARAALTTVAGALAGDAAAAKTASRPLALLGSALESERRNAAVDVGAWPAVSPAAAAA